MPKNKRYPHETQNQFKKRQKRQSKAAAAQKKRDAATTDKDRKAVAPRYAFDLNERQDVREGVRRYKRTASTKDIGTRIKKLRKRYNTMSETGRNTGTDKYARLRVKLRTLLGAQAGKTGVSYGKAGSKKNRKKKAHTSYDES